MKKILFVDTASPLKPLLAADLLAASGRNDLRVEVATSNRDAAVAALSAQGVSPLPVIHELDGLHLAVYDLVIRFNGPRQSDLPALPGSPAFLNWQVTEPAAGPHNEESLADIQEQIEGLVRNLVSQGYLDALIQTRRTAEPGDGQPPRGDYRP